MPSASGCGVDSDDLSVVGGENKRSLGFVGGAPKLNPELDGPGVVVSPALGAELPNPKPTGFPILPPGFPKANAPVLSGEALPKKLTGLSDDPKMPADVEEDVVALPKIVVVTLELSLLSEGVGLNGDDLLDSVALLLPKIELPNTDVGLDAASEVPNALVDLVAAKKFGTLLGSTLGIGCNDWLADELAVSWFGDPETDLDVVFSMFERAANEKPEVGGRLDVEVNVLEAANVKADFRDSGEVVDEDVDGSVDLDVRAKGICVDVGLGGGKKGGNVKLPVFVPLSLVEGGLEDASANPTDGFGIKNEVVFSGGALAPKKGVELVVTEPRIVTGCEEPSNSD